MLGELGGVEQEAFTIRLLNAPGDLCSQSSVNCSIADKIRLILILNIIPEQSQHRQSSKF